jgi:DNA-directed RNA polymerase specialized sigma24 family protein
MVYYAIVNKDKEELREAFGYIYNLYYRELFEAALFRVLDKEEAEDVVLDSFNDLYTAIMLDKDIKFIRGYLYTCFFSRICKCNASHVKFRENVNLCEDFDQYSNSDNIIEYIELEDLINSLLLPQEKYIFFHYVIRGESLPEIRDKLRLKNVDIFKMYKNIIKKLRKGVGVKI